MKQKVFIEQKVQKYEDIHFLNFLASQKDYLRYNKLKLETYQHERDLSPWIDIENHNHQKPIPYNQQNSVYRVKQQLQFKNPPIRTQTKKKKQVQDIQSNFKLNSTFVQFGVKFKSTSYKQAKINRSKQRSSQIMSGLSKQRVESARKLNEQQSIFKTPKIKFLQRKFRIREGSSNDVRFRIPKTERTLNNTKNIMTQQLEKSEFIHFQNPKNIEEKMRPIHSREIRFRWFE